jgi:hypothetical protein
MMVVVFTFSNHRHGKNSQYARNEQQVFLQDEGFKLTWNNIINNCHRTHAEENPKSRPGTLRNIRKEIFSKVIKASRRISLLISAYEVLATV